MRSPHRASLFIMVLAASFAGCATSDTSGFDPVDDLDSGTKVDSSPGTDTNAGADTATPPKDSASTDGSTTTDTSGTCIPSCTSDDQCASTCASAGSGSNCCDLATGVCYVSADSTCPAPTPDDAGPTPPY